uniref:GMP reductase n=1 Tax=Romanomermis culicivorax TaxID=13658 RepID=A0A915I341_ROMCU
MPRIETDIKLDFKDVLLRPKRSTLQSRNDVDLTREFTFVNSKQKFSDLIPVMASNMDTVGTFEMAKVMCQYDLFTCVHKYYTVEQWRQHMISTGKLECLCTVMYTGISFWWTILYENYAEKMAECVAVSSGINETEYKTMLDVLDACPELKYVCLDVANGYSESFVDFIRKVREKLPKHTIIAGNVVTGEMTEELILSGADIVKVGIGPGSVCTTRKKAGVGYPQLSAILECADAAHGLNAHIISDGGCTCPGDVAKALGAGADFVMLGGMLAGHDQSGGEIIQEADGRKYKLFYGMSSATAMQKYRGGVADYRASEGKTIKIPYKGDVQATIKDIMGGLRSACTYVGALKLKELSKRTTFIRVSQQTNEIFTPFDVPPKH